MLYTTKVIKIGEVAESFLNEGMFILFGDQVPGELEDICFITKKASVKGPIQQGMEFQIADSSFKITSFGVDVQKNLDELGHITVKFDGLEIAELPGTIHLENKKAPKILIGDQIVIK